MDPFSPKFYFCITFAIVSVEGEVMPLIFVDVMPRFVSYFARSQISMSYLILNKLQDVNVHLKLCWDINENFGKFE